MMEFRRIAVIDDDPDMRDSTCEALEDAHFIAKPLLGPFANADAIAAAVLREADAVVCDHKLNIQDYANCLGAQAVAKIYIVKRPAILVTRWSAADMDHIRLYRRWVPVLLTPSEADPDELTRGFEQCREEHEGRFRPTRKSWRALVRVDSVDEKREIAFVVVPGWNPDEVVRFPISMVPPELRNHVKADKRFFAQVNEGAENQADLYFEGFEYRG